MRKKRPTPMRRMARAREFWASGERGTGGMIVKAWGWEKKKI
jgi:hypothetical protein